MSNPFAPLFKSPGQHTPAPGTGPFPVWPDPASVKATAQGGLPWTHPGPDPSEGSEDDQHTAGEPETASEDSGDQEDVVRQWAATTLAESVKKGRERNRRRAAGEPVQEPSEGSEDPGVSPTEPEPEKDTPAPAEPVQEPSPSEGPAPEPETPEPETPEMTRDPDDPRRGQPGVMHAPAEDSETRGPAPAGDGRSSDKARATRRRFSREEVEEIRKKYQYRRELAESPELPDDWRPVRATEQELAEEYGTTQSTIRNVVLGLTYTDAGGPIDTHRRARHAQYQENKRAYGAEVAASMNMSYREAPAPVPATVSITVLEPGKDPRTYTYAPGTTVTVTTVVEGRDD